MDLSMQWLVLMTMLVTGTLLGLIFDSYAVLLTELRFIRRWQSIGDLLYWILALFLVFFLLLIVSHGIVRIVSYWLLLVGFLFYRFTIHTRWINFQKKAVRSTVVTAVKAVKSFRWLGVGLMRMKRNHTVDQHIDGDDQ
jgi:spore cortex biosynthesis protein YabQ